VHHNDDDDNDDKTPRTAPGRQIPQTQQQQPQQSPDMSHHNSNSNKNSNIISFPLYERSYSTPRYSLVTPRPSDQKMVPAGMALHTQDASTAVDLDLTPLTTGSMNMDEDNHGSGGAQKTETTSSSSSSSVPQYQHQQNNKDHNSIANLRIRGKDKSILQRARQRARQQHHNNISTKGDVDASSTPNPTSTCFLHGVYFPLLAPLIPLWLHRIHDKYNNYVDTNDDNDNAQAPQVEVKKVVILVTGVGTPRNWTHSITGNSTELCATLMKLYLRKLYPDLTVVTIHSNTNLFRYDENILFAKEELMPCLESLRDAHARGEPYPDYDNDEDEEEWHTKQQQQQDKEQDYLSASLSAGMFVDGQDIIPNCSNNNNAFLCCLPCGAENDTETSTGLCVGLPPLPPTTTTSTRNDYDPDWRDTFHICLSFADGSPARTHAIQASLRPYKPTYFHFWQLKSFWHSLKISGEDIEILTHQDMETVPAMDVQELLLRSSSNKHKKSSSFQTNQTQNNTNADADDPNYNARLVVEEMQRFKQDFLKSVSGNNAKTSDMKKFWLRKSQKPVLAVLLVEEQVQQQVQQQQVDGNSSTNTVTVTINKLYRGTNMEVSMPTGSLCAERNVIGSALAANPGLRREDLKMVAVLAITLPLDDPDVPPPQTQSQTQLHSQPDSSGGASTTGSASVTSELRRSLSYASFVSIAEDDDDHDDNINVDADVDAYRHSRTIRFSEEKKAIRTANLLLQLQPSGKFNPIFDNRNMDMTLPDINIDIPTLDLDALNININDNLVTNHSPSHHDDEYDDHDHVPPRLNDDAAHATRSHPHQVVMKRTMVKHMHINILSHSDAESDGDADGHDDVDHTIRSSDGGEQEQHSSAFVTQVVDANGAPHQQQQEQMQVEEQGQRQQRSRSSSTSSAYSTISTTKNKSKKKPAMGETRMKQKKVATLTSQTATALLAQLLPDLNPLKPCGACNEWLKKIAEPNPNFKVLTFTDADCHGVYVTPVLD
jgi:cytidine deaminase